MLFMFVHVKARSLREYSLPSSTNSRGAYPGIQTSGTSDYSSVSGSVKYSTSTDSSALSSRGGYDSKH